MTPEPAQDTGHDGGIRKSLVVLATPRTGSTLLGRLLGSTGLLPVPEEVFSPTFRAQVDQGDAPLWEYVRFLHEDRSSPDGVFGAKLQRADYASLRREAREAPADPRDEHGLFHAVFPSPEVMFVRRRDKLRQAVSWYRALRSGVWQVHVGGQEWGAGKGSQSEHVRYDFVGICRRLAAVHEHERRWLATMQRLKLSHTEFWYDSIVDDPGAAVAKVLARLGYPPGAGDPPQADIKRLADQTTEEWVERFQADAKKPAHRALELGTRAAYRLLANLRRS